MTFEKIPKYPGETYELKYFHELDDIRDRVLDRLRFWSWLDPLWTRPINHEKG